MSLSPYQQQERWQTLLEKLENHPYLENQLYALHPWIRNRQLQLSLDNAGVAAPFLVGCCAATIGIYNEKSATGWMGPGIEAIAKGVKKFWKLSLPSLSIGDQCLLEAVTDLYILSIAFFSLYTLQGGALGGKGLSDEQKNDKEETYRINTLLFFMGSETMRTLVMETMTLLGKSKSIRNQSGELARLLSLFLSLLFIQKENPQQFEEVFTELQPFVEKTIHSVEESIESLQEQPTQEIARWITTLQTLLFAWKNEDPSSWKKNLPSLWEVLGVKQEEIDRDIERLRTKIEQLGDEIQQSFLRRDEAVTSVTQSV